MENRLQQRSSKPIAIWLMIGVGMLVVQILLGGITRLTGSGLSITEWDVVTGALPPMNETAWLAEFDKYRQTPQFHLLNHDFTLHDFKSIFFWEWFHRFWARLMGVVFLVPFLVFLKQKRFSAAMVKPMVILFLLGALQGAVGWIMVASGLTGDAIYVKPTKLALHFLFALGLLCYTFWFALSLYIPAEKRTKDKKIRTLVFVTITILILQLFYGALMAGHKAATAAPTWPDINGQFIPSGMFSHEGGLINLIDNKFAVHFIHRSLAYLLVIVICLLTFRIYKNGASLLLRKTWWLPLSLVLIQAVIGIATVLNSLKIIPNHWGPFEWFAQAHQFIAMCLLLSFIWVLYLTSYSKSRSV